MVFDNPKDVVSGKILFFSNVFSFPDLNWAPK